MRRAITVACTTAAIVVGGSATATAAPPEQEVIPLVCDDGTTYTVVVNGNGAFTPGRVVDSNRVFVPIAFEDLVFRAVPPGEDPVEMRDPGFAKGGGNVEVRNRDTLSCTFEISDTLTEEEDGLPPGTVVTFSGEVTGFLTGRP